MNKAKLLEFNLLGSLTWGICRICYKTYILCSILGWRILQKDQYNRVTISNLNVESWNSKDNIKIIIGTGGLPKVQKNHGNRGVIIPITGRTPAVGICNFSTIADGVSTVSTDGLRKIQKINELCREREDFIVSDKLYNILYDKELYYVAFQKLKSNPGNLTPGINPTTLDGLSEEVILEIISKIKDESFQFSPGRRVCIPKAYGGERPLTIAPPRDKLVQECMRMILEAIYEPSFHARSHGFRPNLSCHSALKEVRRKLGMARWFIEGDISKCFDSIDHEKLMNILGERIKDRRFLDLVRKALRAGYMEFRRYSHSVAGTPQGSIISPILANIFLDKLDRYIDTVREEFNVGNKATINPEYKRLSSKKERTDSVEEKKNIRKILLITPSKLHIDPNASHKKLEYIRYADDWIIGVRGSLEDCRIIVNKIDKFINEELNLDLSKEKTKITNAGKEVAKFLSVDIHRKTHRTYRNNNGIIRRNVNNLRLAAPIQHISKKLQTYGFLKGNIPYPKFKWMNEDKDAIILLYNSIYRGIVNYYRFTDNFNELSSKIYFILKNSCARLLAAKFKTTQGKIYKKYGKNLKGGYKHPFIDITLGIRTNAFSIKSKETLIRFNAEGMSKASLEGLACTVCESEYRVEMHHIRMMKDLDQKKSLIDRLMIKKRRKQIPLGRKCHMA
uniref:hypothetical protein n=1 Tax=Dematophora necatrix TaxID=2751867 RepID=UPI0030E33902